MSTNRRRDGSVDDDTIDNVFVVGEGEIMFTGVASSLDPKWTRPAGYTGQSGLNYSGLYNPIHCRGRRLTTDVSDSKEGHLTTRCISSTYVIHPLAEWNVQSFDLILGLKQNVHFLKNEFHYNSCHMQVLNYFQYVLMRPMPLGSADSEHLVLGLTCPTQCIN